MRKIAGYKFQRRHRDTHTQIETHTHIQIESAHPTLHWQLAHGHPQLASASNWPTFMAFPLAIEPVAASTEMLPLSGFFFLSWCNKYLIPCRQLVLQTMINRKSSRLRATERERERERGRAHYWWSEIAHVCSPACRGIMARLGRHICNTFAGSRIHHELICLSLFHIVIAALWG